jgi:RimJ/RimL family protein N-acetyltransferase
VSTTPDLASKPTIHGRLVTLRPFRDGDVEEMAQVLGDPEVRRLTGSVTTSHEAEQAEPLDERLREWYATRNDQPDRLDLAIEDRATGRLVGEVVLNELDRAALTCNLRVLVGPAGRGRGLGTEAVGLATRHGIRTLGLSRVTLEVLEFNPRGQRVYEKVGYVVTGVRPDALRFDGVAVAAIDMAVDADTWPGFPPPGGAGGQSGPTVAGSG